jgi:GNAT superfamily N-acetyltransferase
MTGEEILRLYDQDQRFALVEPAIERLETAHTVRYVNLRQPHGFMPYLRDANEANIEQIISDEIAYFEQLGYGFEWKAYSHDTPPDLVARLVARGFDRQDDETICALDLADLPAALASPIHHDVRRITDPNAVRDLLRIQDVAFGESHEELAAYLRWMLSEHAELIRFYAAYVDGVAASCAWLRSSPGGTFAGLWGGATLPSYRGSGLYTALVAKRAQEAKADGVRFLTIDASAMSLPIVEKLGFVRLCTAVECQWRRT